MLFRIHNNELSRSGSRPQNIINCFIGRTFPNILSITPIFKSLHLLKVNERIEYKLFSLTCKVLTAAQPSYLHNLITLQPPRTAPHLLSLFLSRQPSPPWKSQIAHLDVHHLVFGISFPIHSVSLTSLVSIHLLIHKEGCKHHCVKRLAEHTAILILNFQHNL